ncbi:hypothetical protein VM98_38115, partial [Streptomyces rubellomurinus subsp. indigoferus]
MVSTRHWAAANSDSPGSTGLTQRGSTTVAVKASASSSRAASRQAGAVVPTETSRISGSGPVRSS